MAYSDDFAYATDVIRLIKQWSGYGVLTNLPYFKGCRIVKRINKDKFLITQYFNTNGEAKRAMMHKGWHPDPEKIKLNTFNFSFGDGCDCSKALTKDLLKKIKERIFDMKEIGKQLGLNSQELENLTRFEYQLSKKLI